MKKCYSTCFSYFFIRNYVARALTFYSARFCIFFYNNRLSFINLVCVKSTVKKIEVCVSFRKYCKNQVHFRIVKPKLNKATSTFNFAFLLSSGLIWLQKFCIMEMKLLKRQLKNASFESKDTCKYFL